MSKTKFTPGPWRMGTPYGLKDPQGNWVGSPLRSVFANDETESRGPTSIANCITENAALIAAAPEMYEGIESLIGCIGAMLKGTANADDIDAELRHSKQVLKKARGEK